VGYREKHFIFQLNLKLVELVLLLHFIKQPYY